MATLRCHPRSSEHWKTNGIRGLMMKTMKVMMKSGRLSTCCSMQALAIPRAVAVAEAIVQRLRDQQVSARLVPDEERVSRMLRVLDAHHTDDAAINAAHAFL